VAGAQAFMSEKQIALSILDTLFLFKSKMNGKTHMQMNTTFSILKDIMKAHNTDILVYKKVIRLYDKKLLALADEEFVQLVVAMFQLHAQDEDVQKESMAVLTLCLTRDASFQSTVFNAGGSGFILDLYAMRCGGIFMPAVINIILLLTTNHADNSAVFGSMTAIMIYLDALIDNIDSEDAFNLACVPIFFALKTFTEPAVFVLDDSFLEPITNLFAYADKQEDDVKQTQVMLLILKFVRELCTIQSSIKLLLRSGFSLMVSAFTEPHIGKVRKWGKSITKKLVQEESNL
jgi:hypothetical protein